MLFTRSLAALALTLIPNVYAFSGKTCRIMPLGGESSYFHHHTVIHGLKKEIF